jgi:branched-chain amino acid transport system permease protein
VSAVTRSVSGTVRASTQSAGRRLSGISAIAATLIAGAVAYSSGVVTQQIAFTVAMTVVFAVSWNMIGGLAGQHSFAHPCLFGGGAYIGGLLLQHNGSLPLPVAVLAAAGGATVIALVLSPTLRVRGAYFAILTVAVSEGAGLLAVAYFPGGSSGLFLPIDSSPSAGTALLYALALVVLLLAAYQVLQNSRAGTALRMIRDDETGAAAVGVPVRRLKALAFVVGAPFVGAMGAIYGANATFIGPSDVFSLNIAVTAMLATLVGGVGLLWGALIGGVAWQLLLQYSTGITGHPGASTILDGAVLLAVVLLMPRGLVGMSSAAWSRWGNRWWAAHRPSQQPGQQDGERAASVAGKRVPK